MPLLSLFFKLAFLDKPLYYVGSYLYICFKDFTLENECELEKEQRGRERKG